MRITSTLLRALILFLFLSGFTGLVRAAGSSFTMGTGWFPLTGYDRLDKGHVMEDPVFHVPLTRLTDINTDHYTPPGITNEYSRSDPSNADGSLLILAEPQSGDWLIFNGRKPYNKIKKVGAALGGDIEPRWDPVNPNLFYAFREMSLIAYDVRNDKVETLYDFKKDFPKAEIAGTGSEGEPSEDYRWWTVLLKKADGQPVAVVCFDKSRRAIVSRKTTFEYNLDKTEVNWVGTCPLSGDPLIGWVYRPEADQNGSYHRGVIRYDKQWNKVTDTFVDGHADVAVGKNNEELLVYQNNANDWVETINLGNGQVTRLFPIPFPSQPGSDMNMHFSGNIVSSCPRKGWALMVVDESKMKNSSWISNQICLLELKEKPRIWRLGYNHNNYCDTYPTECFATISRDGQRVYFQSNWGSKASFDGEPGRFTEEYMLTLPKDWQTFIGS